MPIVAATSREIVRLYAHLFGRGPTKARTRLGDDFLLCVLGDVFNRGERTLIEAGRSEVVISSRAAVHEAITPRLVRIVEEQTGRVALACIGQVDTEADLAVEFFQLGVRSADD